MRQRIITAIIALLIFFPIVIYGGLPFIMLTLLMATIGLYELLRSTRLNTFFIPSLLSYIVLWLTIVGRISDQPMYFPLDVKKLWLGLIVILLAYTVFSKNKFTFNDVGTIILSMIYVTIGFYLFIYVRGLGLKYLLFVLFVIWTTDTGAYFSGRFFGKRKLWPSISPNKTIEGAVGGLLLAIFVSLIFTWISPLPISTFQILGYGIIISMSGQVGDLVASALKRQFEIKDFGTLLPGHGGILDRFDSLLFVLPILYILQFM